MWENTLVITVVLALLFFNAVGVVLVALQLPGTWLMLLATAVVAWWRWESGAGGDPLIGWWALGGLLLLAVAGEVIEFVAGAWGASRAGASKRAAMLAILGGVVGAVAGMIFLAFIPIVGVLIGAAIGAALGTIVGDRWAGRSWEMAMRTGRGAAVGKFWGAMGKLIVAVVMWLVVLVAVVWP